MLFLRSKYPSFVFFISLIFTSFFAHTQSLQGFKLPSLTQDTVKRTSMRGMFSQLNNTATVSDCKTGKIVHILPQKAYKDLMTAYEEVRKAGENRMYVEIEGYLAEGRAERVIVEKLRFYENTPVCPSAAKSYFARMKADFFEYGEATIEWGVKLGIASLILTFGFWFINFLNNPIKSFIDKRLKIDPSVKSFLKSLLFISLRISLIMLAGGFLGIRVTGIVALFSAATLAIGFALQGSLSNFAGGFIILLMKQFKVGEKITAQGYTGEVRDILMFNTVLDTGDGRRVMIPNGPLLNNTIINHTRAGYEKRVLKIFTTSDVDTEHLKAIIIDQMTTLNDDTLTLAPDVKVTDWNGDRIEITVSYQTPSAQSGATYEKVVQSINNRLRAEEIKLYPTMTGT
ncbi:mechanosensitive ion channel [Runella sp. MFBS21]|uniref:mechanosensitive ion channel domain-containing protein n=1 Tax=Runella sp. MFBS21 TaxID=3034018 RepID=UPI0023F9807E|nr:mechanosensitive ion channel domain-containing protein [Runella sp. MFBS21]MDF7819401.1 mechanosensitive ion channel [Runella sp. MFBS21]